MSQVYIGWLPDAPTVSAGYVTVKVGMTNDYMKRAKQIGQGVPYRFEMSRVFTGVAADVIEDKLLWMLRQCAHPLCGEWFDVPDSGIDRLRAADVVVPGKPPFDDECQAIAYQIAELLVSGPLGCFLPVTWRGPRLPIRSPVVSPATDINGDLVFRGEGFVKPHPARRPRPKRNPSIPI